MSDRDWQAGGRAGEGDGVGGPGDGARGTKARREGTRSAEEETRRREKTRLGKGLWSSESLREGARAGREGKERKGGRKEGRKERQEGRNRGRDGGGALNRQDEDRPAPSPIIASQVSGRKDGEWRSTGSSGAKGGGDRDLGSRGLERRIWTRERERERGGTRIGRVSAPGWPAVSRLDSWSDGARRGVLGSGELRD
ncbi:hypothetical protein Mp_6g05020 [Marchantia polymorpha subsp. ruderalis]|uniref:Uncharacterized protein n=2 Tax=Marchantia polymorpha TaxID=3197 RepID=A0AAF6BNN7_MARPO|nr:hypothetical protein MARPO_0034s0015 [Marchantia polymorpha]BBN13621.1 hypothetical protein Mp_6g05020 [Marchantia polymorpha subsp. ruderalis]|eukprot:PTQ41407.1 hypothetical protein MARPO_0034s0015 [Marchantia polymorpha]